MLKFVLAAGAAALCPLLACAAEKPTRLWNLTGATISKFELAPAGTTNFGPDQCKNDKDGAVEDDERLAILGVAPGQYDARITYPGGRVCFARGLKIETGAVFQVDKDQLKDCNPPK